MDDEMPLPEPDPSVALVPPPRLPPIGIGTTDIPPVPPNGHHPLQFDDENTPEVRMPFRILAGILCPGLIAVGLILVVLAFRGISAWLVVMAPVELLVGVLFGYVALYGHTPTSLEERRMLLRVRSIRRRLRFS